MDRHIEAFLEMVAAERGAARNTLLAYQADLDEFAAFAAARGCAPAGCEAALLQSYMAGLQRAGLSARTAAREGAVAVVRHTPRPLAARSSLAGAEPAGESDALLASNQQCQTKSASRCLICVRLAAAPGEGAAQTTAA
jgi:integrase/recombinase XerD